MGIAPKPPVTEEDKTWRDEIILELRKIISGQTEVITEYEELIKVKNKMIDDYEELSEKYYSLGEGLIKTINKLRVEIVELKEKK